MHAVTAARVAAIDGLGYGREWVFRLLLGEEDDGQDGFRIIFKNGGPAYFRVVMLARVVDGRLEEVSVRFEVVHRVARAAVFVRLSSSSRG